MQENKINKSKTGKAPNSEVKEILLAADIDAVGITSAEPFPEHYERLKQLAGRGFNTVPDSPAPAGFCDFRQIMPGAKSVICAAECYLTSEKAPQAAAGNPLGSIARYTWRNYYRDLRQKLEKTAKILKKRFGAEHEFKCFSCAPSGKLPEKLLAARSGAGYYGKNAIIRNETFGSWIVLGEIVTTLDIEPDTPASGNCGECRVCMNDCPTGAITEPYTIDRRKCLQSLMNWPGILPVEIREVWGDRLYGCTTCQDACPKNKNIRPKERKPGIGHVGPALPLPEIIAMSEETFRKRFKNNQLGAGWINFDCIRRNAVVALGNSGDKAAIPALTACLEDTSEMVRVHAAWAIDKLKI